MIRKAIILILYIIGFWIILPFCLLYFSLLTDKALNFTQLSSPFLKGTGIVLLVFSLPLLVVGIYQFKKFSGEFPVSATPPQMIVRKGIYAVWRHPIYLFYTLVFMGIALVIASGSMLLIIMPFFTVLVILYVVREEQVLLKRFGSRYRNYLKQTSRILPALYYLIKIPGYLFFKIAFSYEARNRENIPDSTPFFIVSSHRNYLDPFLIALSMPFRISYVTTFEMFRKPLTAWFFHKIGCIPKKRYLNDVHTAKQIIQLLDEDRVIGIFPEGERSWTERMNSFKPETLNLFKKFHDIPILPVKIEGNFYAWPRWSKKFRRSKVVVTFRAPVKNHADMELSHMEDQLTELIKPDDDRLKGFAGLSGKRAFDVTKIIYRCPVCLTCERVKINGGQSLVCVQCKQSFELDPYYHVQYNIGGEIKEMSLGALYDNIKICREDIMNLDGRHVPDGMFTLENDSVLIHTEDCQISYESGKKMLPVMKGNMGLSSKHIYISSREKTVIIPYKNMGSVTIESNFKLQIYDNERPRLYQLIFTNTSAKKWQDMIVEMMKYTGNSVPNTR